MYSYKCWKIGQITFNKITSIWCILLIDDDNTVQDPDDILQNETGGKKWT